MKNNIFKLCVLGVGVALVILPVFKIPVSNLLSFSFLLLCPLMHLAMMQGEHKKRSNNKRCH